MRPRAPRPLGTLAIRLAVAGLSIGTATLGAACVALLTGVPESAEACRFSGQLSDCGLCVDESCAQVLEDCCDEGACGGALDDLDRCARDDDAEACEALQRNEEPAGEELATCVRTSCALACVGVNRTSCTVSEGSCSCSISEEPDAVRCPPVGGGFRCCATADWPSGGETCSCREIGCDDTFGCTCGPGVEATTTACTTSEPCCWVGDVCECGFGACDGIDAIPVEVCAATEAPCPAGLVEVSTCHFAGQTEREPD